MLDAVAAMAAVEPQTVKCDGLTVQIDWIGRDSNAIRVEGKAWRDDKPLHIEWPLVIVNPPALVPDPRGCIEIVVDKKTGETVTCTDDPDAVLAWLVTDIVGSL